MYFSLFSNERQLLKFAFLFGDTKKGYKFALASESMEGALAQLVEQWTENPCVPSSNLGGTTKSLSIICWGFSILYYHAFTKRFLLNCLIFEYCDLVII